MASQQAQDMFWAAPPLSRTITAVAALLSWPGHLLGVPSLSHFLFEPVMIFTLRTFPQIWRLVSGFLITGPQLGLIFDPVFLFRHASNLERNSSRFSQPGSFFVYLVFVAAIVLPIAGMYFESPVLLSPLTFALVYTDAQENPNQQVNFFVAQFAMKWLPYVMLAMTCVMGSPYTALVQATGVVAGHAYEFATKIWPEYGGGRPLVWTPEIVQKWFAPLAGAGATRGTGTAYGARSAGTPAGGAHQRPAGGSGGGWASGFSGGWGERGPGRRLG